MKKFSRLILSLVTSLALVLFISSPAYAATSQDVTITGTPAYITIGNTPDSYNFGTVYESTNYTTGSGYFSVSNNSSVACNITVSVTSVNWTGGAGWGHDDGGVSQSQIAALLSSNNTGAYNIVVKNAAPNQLYPGLPANIDFSWELQLSAPTAFFDAAQKSITVRLTAS